jgi:hypothetical protein
VGLRSVQETDLPDVGQLFKSQSSRLTVSLCAVNLSFRNCSFLPAFPQIVSKFQIGTRNANPSARAAVVASAVKRGNGFSANRYSREKILNSE